MRRRHDDIHCVRLDSPSRRSVKPLQENGETDKWYEHLMKLIDVRARWPMPEWITSDREPRGLRPDSPTMDPVIVCVLPPRVQASCLSAFQRRDREALCGR